MLNFNILSYVSKYAFAVFLCKIWNQSGILSVFSKVQVAQRYDKTLFVSQSTVREVQLQSSSQIFSHFIIVSSRK